MSKSTTTTNTIASIAIVLFLATALPGSFAQTSSCDICPGNNGMIPDMLGVFGTIGTQSNSCANTQQFALTSGMTPEQCSFAQSTAEIFCGCSPVPEAAGEASAGLSNAGVSDADVAQSKFDFNQPVVCGACFDNTPTTSPNVIGGQTCAQWDAEAKGGLLSFGECLNLQIAVATAPGNPCGCASGGAAPALPNPAPFVSPVIPPAVAPVAPVPAPVVTGCPDNGIFVAIGIFLSNPSNFGMGMGGGGLLDFLASITLLDLSATICYTPSVLRRLQDLDRRKLQDSFFLCDPEDIRLSLNFAFENPQNVLIDLPLPDEILFFLSSLTFLTLDLQICLNPGTATRRHLASSNGTSVVPIGIAQNGDDSMMMDNLEHLSYSVVGSDEASIETVTIDQQSLKSFLDEAPHTAGKSKCEFMATKNNIVCAKCSYESNGEEVMAPIHGECE